MIAMKDGYKWQKTLRKVLRPVWPVALTSVVVHLGQTQSICSLADRAWLDTLAAQSALALLAGLGFGAVNVSQERKRATDE